MMGEGSVLLERVDFSWARKDLNLINFPSFVKNMVTTSSNKTKKGND